MPISIALARLTVCLLVAGFGLTFAGMPDALTQPLFFGFVVCALLAIPVVFFEWVVLMCGFGVPRD
jgi:hypothetical protein